MFLTDEDLAPIQALYDQGKYVQASAQATAMHLPSLSAWRGEAGRVLAARLAYRLGAQRLSGAILHAATREWPASSRVKICWLYNVFGRRGAFAAWQQLGDPPSTDANDRCDWWCLQAVVLATLRDFDAAHRALAEAAKCAPQMVWVHCSTATVLEHQDRVGEALAAAEQAKAVAPHVPVAHLATAHLLQAQGREADAVRVLRAALERFESHEAAASLSYLLEELGDYAAALAAAEQTLRLAPLADKGLLRWGASRRCDLALRLDDLAAAREHALAADTPFYRALAARLADANASIERVVLPVPFVRQHHMTCGPATLVSLAQFFGRIHDHLSVADEICYGGTDAANTRRWALRNGFAAREFTLTVDTAHELLRRGLPFAVTTTEVTSGHVQAVIGFDRLRGTLLVRDPGVRHTREWLADEFLHHYRSTGPRALLLLPLERVGQAADVALRDEPQHDDNFALQQALLAHDHARAAAAHQRMCERDEDHPLTIEARWALSAYERDPVGELACTERLLLAFPADQRLLRHKAACLFDLNRVERTALLEQCCQDGRSDPIFAVMLAEDCRSEAHGAPTARRLLHQTLRRQPSHAPAHFALGILHWQLDDAAAEASLRFAACLDDTNEAYAARYFDWCRTHQRTEQGLAFLQARAERWRRQNGAPSVTLYQALLQVHREDAAVVALARARHERPEDGALLLAAAEEALRIGDAAGAEDLLRRAEGHTLETHRSAALAVLAERAGDLERALRLWQSVVQREPLNESARAAVFGLTERYRGRAVALADLQAATTELPFAHSLRRTLARELGYDNAAAAVETLRQIAAIDPGDAWVLRELAWQLARQGHLTEALAVAESARTLEPAVAASHTVHGQIARRAGNADAARTGFQTALELDLDQPIAIAGLVELAADLDTRHETLQWLADELQRRSSGGQGLRRFHRAAAACLPASTVRGWLESIRRAQPDVHAATSVLIAHHLDHHAGDEALQLAAWACDRFPLLPRAWLDRARVARELGVPDECAALERAARLAPDSGEAACHLATAYVKLGRADAARTLLERMRSLTRDASVLALLARLHDQAEAHDAALACAREALHIDCDHEVAWGVLQQQAERSQDAELLLRTARELAQARPHDAQTYLALTHVLSAPEHLEERLQALDRAIALDPFDPDPYEQRAEILTLAGRHQDALSSLRASPQQPRPFSLLGREAWIQHQAGRVDDAIAAMQAVLARQPFYTWGWRQLLDWLEAAKRTRALRSAAATYVRHCPGEATAHAWMAHCLMLDGQRRQAKTYLATALSLDDSYAYAAHRLAQLHLEDGELDDAQAQLARYERLAPGTAQLLHLQIAVARGERPRVREHLLKLVAVHGQHLQTLRTGADVLAKAGLGALAREWLAERLAADDVATGMAWMCTWTTGQQWHSAVRALREPRLTSGAFAGAATVLIEDLTNRGEARRVVSLVRGRMAKRIREPTLAWALAAHAFNTAGRFRATVRWMRDWKDRVDLTPSMLVALVDAQRVLGKHEDAQAVSAAALTLEAQEPHSSYHRTWLALDAYCRRDLDAASALLAAVQPQELWPSASLLLDLVQGLVAALSGSPQTSRIKTANALRAAHRRLPTQATKPVRKAVWHAASAARQHTRLWRWWWLANAR